MSQTRGREVHGMSKKRRLETVGSFNYSKLPRLEAEAGPGYPLDNRYGYKRSYLDYSLQCQECPKPHWAPTSETYSYGRRNPANQQLRAEKAFCPLYPRTPTGKETNGEGVSQETLSGPEKWASWTGDPDFSSQGWVHGRGPHQSPQVPAHCPNLAVPIPVYQNHGYSPEPGYIPKALGVHVKNTPNPSLGIKWHIPQLGYPGLSDSAGVPRKATLAKPSSPPGPKHSAVARPGFLPYHKTYGKCHGGFGGSFMEVSYPVACKTQENLSEAHDGSPGKSMWSKQSPPTSSHPAHPALMVRQDRSPACYALPPYPSAVHEQMLLYHQGEKMNSGLTLPVCNGFGSLEDPHPVPSSSYFPLMHESYYLPDRYFCRTSGLAVTSPDLLPSGQAEHRQKSKAKADMGKPPSLVPTPPEKASYGSSLPRNRGTQDCLEGNQAMDSVTDNRALNQCPAPEPQPSQPLHSLEQSPFPFRRSGQTPGDGSSGSEKTRVMGEKQASPSNPSLLTSDTQKRCGDIWKTETAAQVITSDSSRAQLHSSSEGDQSINVPEDSSSTEEMAQSINETPERPPPPLSPPMPVINNVFSLAPYRDYLEGTSDTVDLALSNSYQSEDIVANDVESQGPGETDGTRSSGPSKVPSTDKATFCSGVAEITGDITGIKMEDSPRASESVEEIHLPASVSSKGPSRGGLSDRTGEEERAPPALEPGCKTEGVRELPPEKKAGAMERENSQSKDGELQEGSPSKQEPLLETIWNSPELLPLESRPERKGNFQSSVAFLFKKFRILKSHAASLGQSSSPQFQPDATKVPVLPKDSSLQLGHGQVLPLKGGPPVFLESPSQVTVQPNAEQTSPTARRSSTQQTCPTAPHSPRKGSPLLTSLLMQENPQQESTRHKETPVQPSPHQAATLQVSSPAQDNLHHMTTRQSDAPVRAPGHPPLTLKVSSPVQRKRHRPEARQRNSRVQRWARQPLTLKVSSPTQRSRHQAEMHQNNSPVQQSVHQPLILKVSLPVQPSPHQGEMGQSNSPVQQSAPQPLTLQVSSPIPRSPHEATTQQTSPSVQPDLPQATSQPKAQVLELRFFTAKPSDASKVLPPSTPAHSPKLGEAQILVPSKSEPHGQCHSTKQYFTALHNSICNTISSSVTTSSLEQLQEWLKKAESPAEAKEKVVSLAKQKIGSKASPGLPKLSSGKQIWLAFKDMAVLFQRLLSQLDTFLLTRKCPFPHVVRAGAIFIPIHVVKEKLFRNLSGASIDHVLQDHKVELRPTTLSEEKLLRDLELKSCTSRMLKLLALKQLPDIYPDLLTLQWHECVKRQLGPCSQAELPASR